MLAAARFNLAGGELGSAADRAYYAMFHAARAAVSLEPGVKQPRTHSGMHTMFVRLFVTPGRLPKTLADNLSSGLDLRHTSTYEVMASVGEQAVQEAVTNADAFLAAVRAYLNLESPSP